jgi:quercetin dioxygenase-like cupin family protein
MKRSIIIALAAAVATLLAIEGQAQQDRGSSSAAGGGTSAHVLTLPDQIKWEDAKALPPGAKMALLEGDPAKEGFIAFRIKLPAGYRIPPHWHPCPERVTVLSGTFKLGMGDKFDESAAKVMPAGSYTSMPPKMHHFAMTEGETVLQLSTIGPWGITYVNPADDPRKP